MRILQLTDLHIGERGEDTFGVDVRANFISILQEIKRNKPDHIVLTGDLCFNTGQLETYQWIYDQMQALGVPYSVIPGNHDDSNQMASVFALQEQLQNGQLYFETFMAGHQAVYLDSGPGVVSEEQLVWLREKVHTGTEPLLVFIHHPPALAGVPFMDINYPLRNHEEVQEILLGTDRKIDLFCGHYHVEKTLSIRNVRIHITPSLFFQMDQQSPTFQVDHHRIGYREIILGTSSLQTKVYYLEGHVLQTSGA
ncbi:MAG: metallophosphoesterase [Bacteroidota bacterium]